MNLEGKCVVELSAETYKRIHIEFGDEAFEYAMEYYKTIPSCKHIKDGKEYHERMRKKFEYLYSHIESRYKKIGGK